MCQSLKWQEWERVVDEERREEEPRTVEVVERKPEPEPERERDPERELIRV
jgi:hypothetical protein